MKIEIDSVNKVVKPVGKVNLKEFLKEVQKLVPDWHEYELDVTVNINWSNPVAEPYKPLSPWAEPYKYPQIGEPYDGRGLPPYQITFCTIE